jgi:DNA-binding XRE family transcriptional regulator
MLERRMSYRMVALQAGVNPATVHRLASGDRVPSLVTALAIIRVFQRTTPAAIYSQSASNPSAELAMAATPGGAS